MTVLGADHGTETGAGRLDLCGQLSGDQGQGGSHLQAIHSSRRTGQLLRFCSHTVQRFTFQRMINSIICYLELLEPNN